MGPTESQFQASGLDKSFVDDLIVERGIVRVRVGFALRSTEIQPSFFDLSLQC